MIHILVVLYLQICTSTIILCDKIGVLFIAVLLRASLNFTIALFHYTYILYIHFLFQKIALAYSSKPPPNSKDRSKKKESRKTPKNSSPAPPPQHTNTDSATLTDSMRNAGQATTDSSSVNSLLSSSSQENIIDDTESSIGQQEVSPPTDEALGRDSSGLRTSEGTGPPELPDNFVTRYYKDSIETDVLKSHIRLAYDAFTFMHQSMGHVLEKEGIDGLRTVLKRFYVDVS